MEKSQRRKHQQAGGEPPRLVRSRSGSSPSYEAHTFASKCSRTPKIEEFPHASEKKTRKIRPEENDGGGGGGFVMFLPRSMSKMEVPRRTRSGSTSPSAWALSPGRSLPCSSPAPANVPKSPASFEKLSKKQEPKGGGAGGAVAGVLKYFRQKKVSPLMEEEYHRFRVAYNRLLQWRFANARGEASMAAVKRKAQKKVFNAWVKISVLRSLILEKRNAVEKQKQKLKLHHVLISEMSLLNEWSKIEPRNVEAVGRVVRKLSAISVCLPLVQNAEGDTMSVQEALSSATGVIDGMKAITLEMHCQVEKTCFLLTELSIMLKQHKHIFEELEKGVTLLASLEAQETSLRVHHFQLATELNAAKA